jgi:hypothetical protein
MNCESLANTEKTHVHFCEVEKRSQNVCFTLKRAVVTVAVRKRAIRTHIGSTKKIHRFGP